MPSTVVRFLSSSRAPRAMAAPTEVVTRVQRNSNFSKLRAGYLFPEISRLVKAHKERHPQAKVISLGIGDTTEPIPSFIADAMATTANGLATREGYSGYGDEQGKTELREAIADVFYKGKLSADEIFVSDGSKCDIGRLQVMFGGNRSVAVQDPSYPVYVDTSVIHGDTGTYSEGREGFEGMTYMICNASNDFFPELEKLDRTDLVFLCSPNNPTGAAATREQLTKLIQKLKSNGSILIYDAAYSLYIEDDRCPKTIYEIPGADEVAIETNSFSKYAGFTGVRCGWTAVPKALKFSDGTPVAKDYLRVLTTCFNGASNIAQSGALAACQDEGFASMMKVVAFYKENAKLLRDTFLNLGFTVYGGINAPFIWVGFPERKSWEVFQEILDKCHIVTTPGSGFGPGGEGFVRVSAFGSRDNVKEAITRFTSVFSK